MERIISNRIRIKISLITCDNFATLVITRQGSNKTCLQEFAENINKLCIANSTKFEILWIPQNNNAAVDVSFKLTDYDDWQTMVKFLKKISNKLGKFITNRFENNENEKTEKFNLSTGVQVHLMYMHLPFPGQANTII